MRWEQWEEHDKALWMQIAEFSSIAKVYHDNPHEFESKYAKELEENAKSYGSYRDYMVMAREWKT